MIGTAVKEKPFTVTETRHRAGSTVRILPSFTSVERLHTGKEGTIYMVIPMHDYAERREWYTYHVKIDGELWPYDHSEVEAMA